MVYKGVPFLLPPPGWQGRAEEGLSVPCQAAGPCLPPPCPRYPDVALRGWLLTAPGPTSPEPSAAQKVARVVIVSIVQMRKPRSKRT